MATTRIMPLHIGKGRTRAVLRLSDTICIENGLSIVENPKPHGKSYNKWLGDQVKANVDRLLKRNEEQKKEQEKGHGQR